MISNCRICGGTLKTVLDLGDFYLSDFLEEGEEAVKDTLALATCNECGLAQLRDTPDLDFLYKDHYWYRSGLNNSMLRDLKDIVENIEKRIELKDGDCVVDIGMNDGSLFTFYTNKKLIKIGFDPAPNLKESAQKNCACFINDYFSAGKFPNKLVYKAKVITTIAMFYDLPDPNKFVEDVKSILDKNGIWVIQLTDLYSLLKTNGIDSINSEHLEYYRLKDIAWLLYNHGLYIFDLEYNKVNGGSLRCYITSNDKYKIEQRVSNALFDEKIAFDSGEVSIEKLKENTTFFKVRILDFLGKFSPNEVYALAASTKANTILQFMGLDKTKIKAIGEVNSDKFGLRTSGTDIPIIPEKEVLTANPKVIIVLAWHFQETFSYVLKDYLKNGGLALYMLPVPYVMTDNGGYEL